MSAHLTSEIVCHRVVLRSQDAADEAINRLRHHGQNPWLAEADVKDGYWAVDFDAPRSFEVDFLRPDLIPPRKGAS